MALNIETWHHVENEKALTDYNYGVLTGPQCVGRLTSVLAWWLYLTDLDVNVNADAVDGADDDANVDADADADVDADLMLMLMLMLRLMLMLILMLMKMQSWCGCSDVRCKSHQSRPLSYLPHGGSFDHLLPRFPLRPTCDTPFHFQINFHFPCHSVTVTVWHLSIFIPIPISYQIFPIPSDQWDTSISYYIFFKF